MYVQSIYHWFWCNFYLYQVLYAPLPSSLDSSCCHICVKSQIKNCTLCDTEIRKPWSLFCLRLTWLEMIEPLFSLVMAVVFVIPWWISVPLDWISVPLEQNGWNHWNDFITDVSSVSKECKSNDFIL